MQKGKHGTRVLTTKEQEIIRLLMEGLTNKDIAMIVGHTELTLKNYLRKIYDKTGMWNRQELALWYLKGRTN